MTDPNEPAFARPASMISPRETSQDQAGLTKREYFAAKAMEGLIAGYSSISFPSPDQAQSAAEWALKHIAAAAVAYADAQIEALNKSEEK